MDTYQMMLEDLTIVNKLPEPTYLGTSVPTYVLQRMSVLWVHDAIAK